VCAGEFRIHLNARDEFLLSRAFSLGHHQISGSDLRLLEAPEAARFCRSCSLLKQGYCYGSRMQLIVSATCDSFGAVFSAKGAAFTASLGQRPRFMAARQHQR
jgi:hypothetical protein